MDRKQLRIVLGSHKVRHRSTITERTFPDESCVDSQTRLVKFLKQLAATPELLHAGPGVLAQTGSFAEDRGCWKLTLEAVVSDHHEQTSHPRDRPR